MATLVKKFKNYRRGRSNSSISSLYESEESDAPLEDFLKDIGLNKFLAPFQESGATRVADLTFLEESDLKDDFQMKLIERRKFLSAMEEWKKMKEKGKGKRSPKKKKTKTKPDPVPEEDETPSKPEPTGREHGDLMTMLETSGETNVDKEDEEFTDDDVEHTYVNDDPGEEPHYVNDRAGEEEEEEEAYDDWSKKDVNEKKSDAGDDWEDHPYEDPDAEAIYENNSDSEPDDYEDPDAPIKAPEPPRVPHRRTEQLMAEPEAAPLPDNPMLWDTTDVHKWLKEKDLKDFQEAFYANGFNGRQLLALNPISFKRGGFSEARCADLGHYIRELRIEKDTVITGTSEDKSSAPMAVVLFDYDPSGNKAHEKLKIVKDETLIILDDAKQWWKVKNVQGQEGLVPSNYLEKMPVIPPRGAKPGGRADLSEYQWYHGPLDRTASASLVSTQSSGSFLVRDSQSNAKDFTLTVKGETSIVQLKIQQIPNGAYVLGKSAAREFASVMDIIDYHKVNPLRVANRETVLLEHPVAK